MRRRIACVGVGALALVAMLAALGAPAASAACPNEAFRTGPSTLLPECRAYEMVTPVDKESAVAVGERGGSPSLVIPSGDGVFFSAPSAYGGAQGSLSGTPYLADRLDGGWGVRSIIGPQQAQVVPSAFTILSGISDDLGLAMVASKEALAPGAISGGSNLYVRDNRTGSYTLVAARPGDQGMFEWAGFGNNPPFVGAATDWSDILLTSRMPLTPGAVEGQPNLFEFSEGGLQLAVAEGERPATTLAVPNVMSDDGSRFYYNQVPPLGQELGPLYLHLRGQRAPILVSEDDEGNPFPARFVGATPNGGIAFLIEPASGGLPGGDLYRFEASAPAGERLTDLTPDAPEGESAGLLSAYTGEDGTTVYFAAKGLLTPDAEPREGFAGFDLYVWHGEPGQSGELRYIGKSDIEEEFVPEGASVSPNGRFFGFESVGRVTPDATEGPAGSCPSEGGRPAGPCLNVFLYSLDAGSVVCATCSGSSPTSISRLGDATARSAIGPVATPVLDDGSVFFETAKALVAQDANGVTDVYRRRGETTEPISTGTDADPSTFIGASASGSDIFFRTSQPLVGQDVDREVDLYDARIGGGLPQGAPAPAPSCVVGVDCRAGSAPGASSAPPGTESPGVDEGAPACRSAAAKARAARKRSRALMSKARQAKGKSARALHRKAVREAKTAARLGRRTGACPGGGR